MSLLLAFLMALANIALVLLYFAPEFLLDPLDQFVSSALVTAYVVFKVLIVQWRQEPALMASATGLLIVALLGTLVARSLRRSQTT